MNYTAVQELLKEAKNVVITTHRSPDGDAMGSSLALYNYFNKVGVKSQVVTPDPYPNFLHWLPANDTVINYEEHQEEVQKHLNEADLIFSLDYNALHRMGALGEAVGETTCPKIMIDHHQQPDDYAIHTLSDTSASSTCELIFDFIQGLGGADHIDVDIAECLYTGIVTDTGSFRFSSTSSKTHRIVASLMDVGLEVHQVHQAIYDTNTTDRLNLLGHALVNRLEVFPKHNAAIISLSIQDMKRFNCQKGDTEGLVNYALSINGVKLAVLIKETEENVRMSLRSKGDFSVNELARKYFNGGGHNNAAGGAMTISYEETINKVKEVIELHASDLA